MTGKEYEKAVDEIHVKLTDLSPNASMVWDAVTEIWENSEEWVLEILDNQ